jgi:ABC-type transport system involved in Fe-S cluster assembly fused permease/ATPase subunit
MRIGPHGRLREQRHGKYEPLDDSDRSHLSNKFTVIDVLRVLAPFFWPRDYVTRIRSLLTWCVVALSKASNLLAPLFISAATDALVQQKYNEACRSIALYCTLRFAAAILKECQGLLFIRVKQQAYIQLAEKSLSHIHNLSLDWHLSKKTGNVIRSMDRGTEAAAQLVQILFMMLLPSLLEAMAVVVIFYVHFNSWHLGTVLVISMVFFVSVVIQIARRRKRARERTNKHDIDFHEKATESIINFETVKYFTQEEFETNRYADAVKQYQSGQIHTQVLAAVMTFFQEFTINTTVAIELMIAANEVLKGRMELGAFVAVGAYVSATFQPLQAIGMMYNGILQGVVDVKSLIDILGESPGVTDIPGAPKLPLVHTIARVSDQSDKQNVKRCPSGCNLSSKKVSEWNFCALCGSALLTDGELEIDSTFNEMNIELGPKIQNAATDTDTNAIPSIKAAADIEFNDVCFRYPSQASHQGVHDITFTIPAGTTTAIVGSTGAGKSTISRLLFRFYDPQNGVVRIGGQDIKCFSQKSVRQCIGVVPQDTVLFNDSLMYNIHYGCMSASVKDIEAAAEAAQIKSFIEKLPLKWDTKVGERGLKLSGGEKQRVAIARCLLKNPPIVILDEATSALDTMTESSVQQAILALGTNRTMLVIAHRLSTIRNADQILVMSEGRIVERGSHDDLMTAAGTYHDLWMMQVQASSDDVEGSEQDP